MVIDTNILISALIVSTSLLGHLMALWHDGKFDILTSPEQLEELKRVTRYEKIRARLNPALAGRFINEFRDLAITVTNLPVITVSRDPHDNYLLAIASAGGANFLLTGDKHDLLGLKPHEGIKIVTVRDFLFLHRHLP